MRFAEYCQQIDYLKMPVDQIKTMLDTKKIRYAFLIHDKDTKKDGTPKEPHLHVMMDFKGTSWEPGPLAKWFNDQPERIEKAKHNRKAYENMCSYLIHDIPSENDGNYHYDPHDVTANFDYVAFIEQIRAGVEDAKKKKKILPISDVLQSICDNKIPRVKLGEHLTDLERIKYKKYIEDAYKIRDEKLAKETDREMNVMYFTGESGSGKTTLAKWFAKQLGLSVFVSGSSNDPLEGYIGQECIILDDIRGSDWKINDLLKLLDNNTNSRVKSRYSNKLMNDCALLILTSVQSPDELYKNLKEHESEPIEQLKRRCTGLWDIKEKTVKVYEYDETEKEYVLKDTIVNPIPSLRMIKKNKTVLDNMMNMLKDFEEVDKNSDLPF